MGDVLLAEVCLLTDEGDAGFVSATSELLDRARSPERRLPFREPLPPRATPLVGVMSGEKVH